MGNKNESYINIIYDINKEKGDEIKIFGSEFVENNKNICKMVIDNKKYEIADKYNIENYKYNRLNIKLMGIDKISDMSYMFDECSSLSSLTHISKWNTNNVEDMSYMFSGCSSLSSLPDISNWNTNNITNMSGIFNWCLSLSSLPDISKWNTNNVTNMSYLFSGCSSLLSLPDISKWNTRIYVNI